MNRRAVALGVWAFACAPRGERYQGALRLGVDEALFWPRDRADGPWQVTASSSVMAAIQEAVKAANGGFAFGGIAAELLGVLRSPAKPASLPRLEVVRLLRSGPEDFSARG